MLLLGCQAVRHPLSELEWTLADLGDETESLVLVSGRHGHLHRRAWVVDGLLLVDVWSVLGRWHIRTVLVLVLNCVVILLHHTIRLRTVPLLALAL